MYFKEFPKVSSLSPCKSFDYPLDHLGIQGRWCWQLQVPTWSTQSGKELSWSEGMKQEGKKRAGSCGQPSWWPSRKSSSGPRGQCLILHLWWILSPEGRWQRWVSSIVGFHTQKPCSQNQEREDPIQSVEAGKMFPQTWQLQAFMGGKCSTKD